jgi:hypothetical protein
MNAHALKIVNELTDVERFRCDVALRTTAAPAVDEDQRVMFGQWRIRLFGEPDANAPAWRMDDERRTAADHAIAEPGSVDGDNVLVSHDAFISSRPNRSTSVQ